MILVVAIIAVIWLLISIYMYFFVDRILKTLLKKKNKKMIKKINILVTLVVMLPVLYILGIWTMVVLHIFFISLFIDIIYSLIKNIIKKENRFIRGIYRCGAIPILVSIVLLGYGYINMHQVAQRDYTVYTEKNIKNDGYKVAFLSDLHFGLSMDLNTLQKYCFEIEKNNPDFVILGGDIIDGNTTLGEMKDAIYALSQIKSKYGVFYVYGNHDKAICRLNPQYTEEELEEELNNSGIIVLEDESYDVTEDLTITGRKDRLDTIDGARMSSKELMKNCDADKYNLLIDHQPCEFSENSYAGYDMMLSGHTHAGQIWPIGLLIDLLDRDSVSYGQAKKDNIDVIVSSGIAGWGYPVRTEKSCEYLIINIENR